MEKGWLFYSVVTSTTNSFPFLNPTGEPNQTEDEESRRRLLIHTF